MRVIVALSGGKASAVCADWAFKNYEKSDIILYFNDTKWEHPDLYRFLKDLENKFNHKIVYDSDGRNPEQVFMDTNFLGNNRVPICSRILKAERLQKFYKDGDVLVFGIGISEKHRASRLQVVYEKVSRKMNKKCILRFPLIEEDLSSLDINSEISKMGIDVPELYKKGFLHNNCYGGCVRAGKAQWDKLFRTFPKIYLDRERVEKEFRERTGMDVHFLKDETLEQLRKRISVKGRLNLKEVSDDLNNLDFECIGICDSQA